MASEKISQLPSITNSAIGANSLFPVVNSTDITTYSIELSQLDLRWGFVLPNVQSFTSGSGTYTVPTSPRVPLYLKVTMAAGGGGADGAGSGAGAGSSGGNTTFGTTLLTCNGGSEGGPLGTGNGGGATVGSDGSTVVQTITLLSGGNGQGFPSTQESTTFLNGGMGGANPFGGAGAGAQAGANSGGSGTGNTGAGGGGAATNLPGTGAQPTAGGGAGGYIQALLSTLNTTYNYSVGAGGPGGTAGATSGAGGSGANGIIIIEAHFQ